MRGLGPTARGVGVAAAGVALLLLGVLTRTNGPYALAALAWVPLLVAPAVSFRRARRSPSRWRRPTAAPAVALLWASSGADPGGRVCWHRPRRRCARFPAWRREKAQRPS